MKAWSRVQRDGEQLMRAWKWDKMFLVELWKERGASGRRENRIFIFGLFIGLWEGVGERKKLKIQELSKHRK